MSIGLTILLGFAASLLAAEALSWAPWIATRLAHWAVRLAPCDLRERLLEEWLSHLGEVPGGLGKLFVGFGLPFAALTIRAERRDFPVQAEKEQAIGRRWQYLPVQTLPQPHEIVWCRLPHHQDAGEPSPRARPGLVRNSGLDEEGNPVVELVFGSSQLKLDRRELGFFVTKQSEMDACGLYIATRFDLDGAFWLPWADEWFETRQGYSSPIIGRLTDQGIQALRLRAEFRRQTLAVVRNLATARKAKRAKPKKPAGKKPQEPPEA